MSTPSDVEILVTRAIDAPAATVFRVWTEPDQVRRWWTDETMPVDVCEIDLRAGGRWRRTMHSPDGTELAWNGEYREVEAAGRLVYTEVFEAFPDAVSEHTVTFSEANGTTTLRMLVRHPNRAVRDSHLSSGMEAGLQRALDRVEHLATSAD